MLLVIQEKHYGANHYQVAFTLLKLSDAYEALGNVAKQTTLLEKPYFIQEEYYGLDHYIVTNTISKFCDLYL